MATLMELLDNRDIDLIFTSVEFYRKHCKKNADSPIRGYGKASEWAKKNDWKNRQEELEGLASKLVEITT